MSHSSELKPSQNIPAASLANEDIGLFSNSSNYSKVGGRLTQPSEPRAIPRVPPKLNVDSGPFAHRAAKRAADKPHPKSPLSPSLNISHFTPTASRDVTTLSRPEGISGHNDSGGPMIDSGVQASSTEASAALPGYPDAHEVVSNATVSRLTHGGKHTEYIADLRPGVLAPEPISTRNDSPPPSTEGVPQHVQHTHNLASVEGSKVLFNLSLEGVGAPNDGPPFLSQSIALKEDSPVLDQSTVAGSQGSQDPRY
ncbi:hypothetical protein BKA70DRAFT_1357260 [Coprinopsis sp. MPI-PUGE-AT-0042]|nr:hypothetical protein BKA70DRAFT_1357260 [Coprinopsis sp. MPI-PUGE-AT-0042]